MRTIDTTALASAVVDAVHAVAALDALAAGSGPIQVGVFLERAERVTGEAGEAFIALAALLYPSRVGDGPDGQGWAFLDALQAARRDGAASITAPLRAA
jgi:hypothetical protein